MVDLIAMRMQDKWTSGQAINKVFSFNAVDGYVGHDKSCLVQPKGSLAFIFDQCHQYSGCGVWHFLQLGVGNQDKEFRRLAFRDNLCTMDMAKWHILCP